jgi:hypothetical protein
MEPKPKNGSAPLPAHSNARDLAEDYGFWVENR